MLAGNSLYILLGVTLVILVINSVQRRKAEMILKSQNSFLQTLVDSIASPVFYKDRQGVYQGCNTAFLNMLGRTKEEVVGKTVYDLSPKKLAEVYEKADNDLFEQGKIQRYETQVKFADGSIHEMFFTKSVFHDAEGELAGLLGVMIDITERKQAEEELLRAHETLERTVEERTQELNIAMKESRDTSEFLNTVINSIDHGIVVVDAEDYSVKLANTAVYNGDCIEGLHCYELLHKKESPCTRDVDLCPLHRVKETGMPTITQHDHVGLDGESQYVEIHTYPVFDDDGKVIQIIDNIMDITTRRQAEKAIVDAKEMAESTNRLLSEFLDTVSHELRTPMTSVHGFSKLTQRSFSDKFAPLVAGDEKLVKAAKRIESNLSIVITESQRMTSLINDQLDLSKLQSGRIEWQQVEIVPADLVARATAAVSSLFEGKGLDLEFVAEEDVPDIVGDPDRLLQVLINLLSNAAKFTEKGAVTCKVSRDSEGVLFSVIDDGIGIPEGLQEDVFNKFKQIQNKLAGKPAGTGLGLAISKEIVVHHNGRIWVESRPDKGSVFSFVIPVR